MIEKVADIISENPTQQVWKFLRGFLDAKYVTELIVKNNQKLQIPDKSLSDNVKKQAIQIGYCIRQAEEYFQASTLTSLATRPVLVYYGAVALSQALVLLRLGGNYSLDYRRKHQAFNHNHHGLELKRGVVANIKFDTQIDQFFNFLECTMFVKGNDPWGHFPLFYRSLLSGAVSINVTFGENASRSSPPIRLGMTIPQYHANIPYPCPDMLPIKDLMGKTLNSLSLLKQLPDLYYSLEETNIRQTINRGTTTAEVNKYFIINDAGEKLLTKQQEIVRFSINNRDEYSKQLLIKHFSEHYPQISIDEDRGPILKMTMQYNPDEQKTIVGPGLIDSISGEHFYFQNEDEYIPEPASMLIILFCLRMLSTYYPDVWMKTVDNNVAVVELVDSLLNVFYRKFPNLILDQLTNKKHFIHL